MLVLTDHNTNNDWHKSFILLTGKNTGDYQQDQLDIASLNQQIQNCALQTIWNIIFTDYSRLLSVVQAKLAVDIRNGDVKQSDSLLNIKRNKKKQGYLMNESFYRLNRSYSQYNSIKKSQ